MGTGGLPHQLNKGLNALTACGDITIVSSVPNSSPGFPFSSLLLVSFLEQWSRCGLVV